MPKTVTIKTPVRYVRMRSVRGKPAKLKRIGGRKFLICASCHHWTARPLVKYCTCSCHEH